MAVSKTPGRCPKCGAAVQASVSIDRWYTLGPDGWKHYGDSTPGELDVRFYCENDHDIEVDVEEALAAIAKSAAHSLTA